MTGSPPTASVPIPRILHAALAESLTLVAGIFYYLTGDPLALGVVAVGVALLLVARPSRLITG